MEGIETRRFTESADFHLDPKKQIDPVETAVDNLGPEEAFDRLMDELEKNPEDTERFVAKQHYSSIASTTCQLA